MLKPIEKVDTSIKKDIIINNIMKSKGVYLLVSNPKVGKSMLALQLSCSVINGTPFLGQKVNHSLILYVTTESDAGQLKERLEFLELSAKNDSLFIIDRQTKAEKYLDELRAETKLIKMEYSKNKDLNKVELKYKDKISDVDTNPLLNPEKGRIIGYKEKDIINLSNYSKEVTKDNLSKDKTIEQNEINLKYKQKQIDKLNNEIRNLKSGKTLQEKDKIIENQKLIIEEKDETINYQNKIINSLRKEISELKETFNEIISNVKEVATDLFKALKRTLGLDVDKEQEYDYYSFKNLSKRINKKYDKDKSDDFEL